MAFLDFLGNDIGGYTGGINDPGGLGQVTKGTGATGITYGDLLGTALKYGSKPGSSGPMFGDAVQSRYGQGGLFQQANNPNGYIDPSGNLLQMPKKQSSSSGIWSALLKAFLGGI